MLSRPPMRAVAFAYHNVGVRCLSVLLAQGVDVPLVVTHRDAPGENIWFGSVAALCRRAGIECLITDGAEHAGLTATLRALAPHCLFSFYYRHMLPVPLLQTASAGAFNMHGSLLPKYRGRVPVNWAVLHGEAETGATLHEMAARPDAGAIIDQQAVPILPNDTALDVFAKVTVAAEMVLCRSLPAIASGSARRLPQDLARGSYFGGRTPEDGRIDWSQDAWQIHNLVRAVAPPYPGAFAFVGARRLRILRTWWPGSPPDAAGAPAPGAARAPAQPAATALPSAPALFSDGTSAWLRCAGGGLLQVVEMEIDGTPVTAENFAGLLGGPLVTPNQQPQK